ncbi:heme-binding protein [Allorhizobium sp. BGMRC 0089]|uniref:GlcG/HbpS family heme-binding protein n=1 Tax=Allorhizobium sonneratiae TaxID=2934936 RepID=UPI002033FA48|nr:heme-binding protein [Allorhizobium sonneratiae]MCM2292653.1 heme-binding protein [Allorhizobium sonneratiae]
MAMFQSSTVLTDEGAITMLKAAIETAEAMGQPQCIAIVDQSGLLLASFRMAGARFLSAKSALAKARTAASLNAASKSVAEEAKLLLAAATQGEATGLPGGLPIRFAGQLAGGIGVGSGSGAEDEAVALAALKAIGADLP